MELLKVIKNNLDKVNASDIKIYNMVGVSALFDYIVVATVDVVRQSNAVISHLEDDFKNTTFDFKSISGANTDWMLLDLSDVIVHVFTYEQRVNYDLDRLFMNIPQINLGDI